MEKNPGKSALVRQDLSLGHKQSSHQPTRMPTKQDSSSIADTTNPNLVKQYVDWNGEDYDAIASMIKRVAFGALVAVGMTKISRMKTVSYASEDELELG